MSSSQALRLCLSGPGLSADIEAMLADFHLQTR